MECKDLSLHMQIDVDIENQGRLTDKKRFHENPPLIMKGPSILKIETSSTHHTSLIKSKAMNFGN